MNELRGIEETLRDMVKHMVKVGDKDDLSSDLRDINDSLIEINKNLKKIAGNTWASANPSLKGKNAEEFK